MFHHVNSGEKLTVVFRCYKKRWNTTNYVTITGGNDNRNANYSAIGFRVETTVVGY